MTENPPSSSSAAAPTHTEMWSVVWSVKMRFLKAMEPREEREFHETEVREATIVINHDDFPGWGGDLTVVEIDYPWYPRGMVPMQVLAWSYEVTEPGGWTRRMAITNAMAQKLAKEAWRLLGWDPAPDDWQMLQVHVQFMQNDTYSHGLICRIDGVESHEEETE